MANVQGFYPKIGGTATTQALDVTSLASLVAPTATSNVTNFQALTNMAGAGTLFVKSAGTVYAIPTLVNA